MMYLAFNLAYAARSYIHETIRKLLDKNEITDNYFYRNYFLTVKVLDGVVCWSIYWGIPQERHNLLIIENASE